MNLIHRILLIIGFTLLLSLNTALADEGDGTFLHTVKEKMTDSKEKEDKKESEKKKTYHSEHEESGNFFFFDLFFRNIRTVGVNYSSFSVPVANATAMSGFGFNLSTSYSYPISFDLEAHYLTGSAGTLQMILNPVIISGKLRLPMTSDINFYGGIGYASTFGSVNGTTSQDSGFVYETGVEYKIIPDLLLASIGYKNIGIAGGSLSGMSGGLNLVF